MKSFKHNLSQYKTLTLVRASKRINYKINNNTMGSQKGYMAKDIILSELKVRKFQAMKIVGVLK